MQDTSGVLRSSPVTRAVRGATSVSGNDREAIIAGAVELMQEVIRQNQLDHADLVSIIFTTTSDLNAEFPAVGARRIGLTHVPLLCATEIPVPGSMKHIIRCLVHINTTLSQEQLRHVYLHEARKLRPDLAHD